MHSSTRQLLALTLLLSLSGCPTSSSSDSGIDAAAPDAPVTVDGGADTGALDAPMLDAGTDTCVLRTCYRDLDADTFHAAFEVCGECPTGTLTESPGELDCDDESADVSPGQTEYFAEPHDGTSFDYDCDETEEPRFFRAAGADATCASASTFEECGLRSGWQGTAVPDCGETADYLACAWGAAGCFDGATTGPLQQTCR